MPNKIVCLRDTEQITKLPLTAEEIEKFAELDQLHTEYLEEQDELYRWLFPD